MKGKGILGSPERSVLNSLQSSPSRHSSVTTKTKNRSLTLVKIKTPGPGTLGASASFVDKKSRARAHTMVQPKLLQFGDKAFAAAQKASGSNVADPGNEQRPVSTKAEGSREYMTNQPVIVKRLSLNFDSDG